MKVLVVGGNVNSTLKTWLRDLFIYEFNHMELSTSDLSPLAILQVSNAISQQVKAVRPDRVIAVGSLASKLLRIGQIDHCTLPHPSKKHEKIEVLKSMEHCRHYLTGGLYVFDGPRVS